MAQWWYTSNRRVPCAPSPDGLGFLGVAFVHGGMLCDDGILLPELILTIENPQVALSTQMHVPFENHPDSSMSKEMSTKHFSLFPCRCLFPDSNESRQTKRRLRTIFQTLENASNYCESRWFLAA